ncbi:substrate-binding periplasmic protein [Vibrio sp. SCSIO 43137]|uniref:substrate-binding periplasmic protein n=1 Tax=Vibrio sp. SCSIO 43137 TaxID=3021011 RepID=UPI002307BA84|nr:transporter substrate-binding domain-containing protein [Vibrio sp. SCSIO 43137]WCE29328.1 transporter substrate-binding domain-containing protein [Vibrio sp. SCSIO 43137]
MKKIILATLLALSSSLLFAKELTFFTEESPPFQVFSRNDNGHCVSGISVEILKLALKETPYTAKIKLLPWARAVNQLEQTPDSFLFSMVRTKEREKKYIWVAPLFPFEIHLWALKENTHININHLDDLKQYRVGVINKNIEQDYFRSLRLEENLEASYSPINLIHKIFRKRVDIIPANEHILNYQLNNEPDLKAYDYKDLQQVKVIDNFFSEAYLVANKNTSPDIVKHLKQALEKIAQTPQYQRILQNQY